MPRSPRSRAWRTATNCTRCSRRSSNADVPEIKAIYLDGEDNAGNLLGVKGLGEVVQVGVAAAIGNAVFNATGRRVRELPITAEALL
ncbi:hypothetical protein OG263_52100 [Streptomyces canus]|nr:hypothetical protein [Streptomyces canus]MCX4862096.1 hypothetical protein [Streptomyces canus]